MMYIFGLIFVAVFTYAVCLIEHRRILNAESAQQAQAVELAVEKAKVEAYIEGYGDGLEAREKRMSL